MASSAPLSSLRQVLDERFSALAREAQSCADAQAAAARRETWEALNQAVRRMRGAETPEQLAATLLDAASGFSSGAAVLRVEGDVATVEAVRAAQADAEHLHSLRIPLASAPALAGAVESRDAVVAAAAPGEVSAELAALPDAAPDGRAWIFPVAATKVEALLYAWGAVESAPLELLAQAAGAVWSGFEKPPAAPLVTIAPAAAPESAWDRLSPDEQQVHWRAQRFARVQTADIRLQHGAAVQAGRARRDLYAALRPQIDAARAAFRAKFFETCPSMVDYLHLEMLRTLANDDSVTLGKDYPGPLA